MDTNNLTPLIDALLAGNLVEAERLFEESVSVKVINQLQEVAPKIYWRVSADGKRVKKRLCPKGYTKVGTACMPASASTKLGRKKAAIKRVRTSKAQVANKNIGARKRKKAMKKRKQQGL